MIKLIGICGSANENSFTSMALAQVVQHARSLGPEVELLELRDYRLPLPGWPESGEEAAAERLIEKVKQADGVFLATPEYHGSYSSGIKLVIDNLGYPSALQGKAIALLGVAGGRIGAIKALEHLSSVCTHSGAIVIPGFISISNVQDEFTESGEVRNPYTLKLLQQSAEGLVGFMKNHVCPRIYLETLVREGVVEAPELIKKS